MSQCIRHCGPGQLPPLCRACVERADRLLDRTLPAGDHRIVVDSFVTAAGAQAGAYTLVIQPCAAGDPDC